MLMVWGGIVRVRCPVEPIMTGERGDWIPPCATYQGVMLPRESHYLGAAINTFT
jgi:hypothetical protein